MIDGTKTATEKIQAYLDGLDARLSEDLKREHPIYSLTQIKKQYPDQWVAILPTKVNSNGDIAAARVFASSPVRQALLDKIEPLKPKCQGRRFTDMFTGAYKFGSNLVSA